MAFAALLFHTLIIIAHARAYSVAAMLYALPSPGCCLIIFAAALICAMPFRRVFHTFIDMRAMLVVAMFRCLRLIFLRRRFRRDTLRHYAPARCATILIADYAISLRLMPGAIFRFCFR